tara:strand:+ start:464 stop:1006 length:543 start_codon:yes stop_codon:yes gene_type:complete
LGDSADPLGHEGSEQEARVMALDREPKANPLELVFKLHGSAKSAYPVPGPGSLLDPLPCDGMDLSPNPDAVTGLAEVVASRRHGLTSPTVLGSRSGDSRATTLPARSGEPSLEGSDQYQGTPSRIRNADNNTLPLQSFSHPVVGRPGEPVDLEELLDAQSPALGQVNLRLWRGLAFAWIR